MKKDVSPWSLLGIAWELGYLIAIPLIALAFGGRFLDHLFDSSPLFFIFGVVVSIILSSMIVYQKVCVLIKNEENKHDES